MANFKTYTITHDEKEKIISDIKKLLENHYEIVFAYIFGSIADEGAEFFRDIDIGVYIGEEYFSKKHSLDYSINLSLEMERALKDYPVDAVVLNDAPLPLAFRVTQGVLLFSKNEALWTDFVTKTWSLYHDHAISSRYLLEDIATAKKYESGRR